MPLRVVRAKLAPRWRSPPHVEQRWHVAGVVVAQASALELLVRLQCLRVAYGLDRLRPRPRPGRADRARPSHDANADRERPEERSDEPRKSAALLANVRTRALWE